MKKILFFLFVVTFQNQLQSQLTLTVQSSCNGSDSLKTAYKKDACRLAIRRVYKINSTYKDSFLPQKIVRSDYLKALMAVFNATGLSVRDTIVKLHNIHTNLTPEMNSMSIKAAGNLNWMQNLQISTVPVGDIYVDFLLSKYYFYPGPYYQSGNYDVAVLRTDSNLNMEAVAKYIKTAPNVIGADPDQGTNFDVKNIMDSINPNFTGLTYTYGWGTCNNGCDYRIFWNFKVYPNCVVEYNGYTGDPLNTAIKENFALLDNVNVYPNPVNNVLKIDFGFLDVKSIRLKLCNALGQTIYHFLAAGDLDEVDMSALSGGIYFLKIESGNFTRTLKVIHQ